MNLNKQNIYIGNCCGNSFIILDCRNNEIDNDYKKEFAINNIEKHKVDSALFLSDSKDFNVSIEIFEKDGSQSESCGNGSILIAYFLNLTKGLIKLKNTIIEVTADMEKQAILMDYKFITFDEVNDENNCIFVKAGEPHKVFLVENINEFDLIKKGEDLQHDYQEGINVDFIQKIDTLHYLIKTYERGVFAITKSCGTGSLSSFIALTHFNNDIKNEPIEFKSEGGIHWVSKENNMLKLETLKEYCEIKEFNK